MSFFRRQTSQAMRGEEGHWFRPWWEAVSRAASLALAITSKTEPVIGKDT